MYAVNDNGLRIHYQTKGKGADVVMVHGLAANLAFWYMRIVPQLAEYYRVTVYDLRGHGLSDVPPDGYSTQDMAGDLEFLLGHLQIDRAHIVGHSLGGAIALHHAILHPERVKSLSLVDCRIHDLQPLHSPDETEYWLARRAELAKKGIRIPDDTPKVVYMMMAELAPLVHQGLANANAIPGLILTDGLWDPKSRGAKRWHKLVTTTTFAKDIRLKSGLTRDAIAQVHKPTQLVYGGDSYCLDTCRELERLLPESQTIVHPRHGHFFPVVDPDLLVQDVLKYLGPLEEGGSPDPTQAKAGASDGVTAAQLDSSSGDPLKEGGLGWTDFDQVGTQGCGDPRNSYIQGMEWFQDALYVGTFRDSLCLMKRTTRNVPPPKMEFWPVKCPEPENPEFLRGQLLRFDPDTDEWELVYRSPMVEVNGMRVMRDVGYRAMAVFQGKSDEQPCLYTGSISATGCRILRSTDGRDWHETVTLDGPCVRSLVPFNGELYTTIIGEVDKAGNEGGIRPLLASSDPASGDWYQVSEPGFGDPTNQSIFEMIEFNGFLYASTMNPIGGMQIWKTDAQGTPPYTWTKIVTAGAYRGFLNEFGLSMAVLGECLYVGTGIAGGGYDRLRQVGPAPAEIIRLHKDDSWELIVGSPRVTPEGIRVPLSGMGPGFNNFLNGYMWRMCVHDNWLYMGTFNGAAFMKYRPHNLQIENADQFRVNSKLLATSDLDQYLDEYGGCHLWRSRDGIRWLPITRNGFGTQYNMGIRQLTSTPKGLFVGVCNPFGPDVAVKHGEEWAYEPNPRGGIEVWRGFARAGAEDHSETPEPEPREKAYKHALLKAGRQIDRQVFSIMLKDFYEETGFDHVGIWNRDTHSPVSACQALLGRLVDLLELEHGTVLDAGCGKGDSTHYLQQRLPGCRVMGIDELGWSIDFGLMRFKDLELSIMDPTQMEFPDNTFDAIVCAERSSFFDTRKAFLTEARRVLRPGGMLVMSDVLFSKDYAAYGEGRLEENFITDRESYRQLLTEADFDENSVVLDVTDESIRPFIAALSAYASEKFHAHEINEGRYNAVQLYVSRFLLFAHSYLLIAARKPSGETSVFDTDLQEASEA